jgi:hypothetical protein
MPLVYQMGDDCIPHFGRAVVIKGNFSVRAYNNANVSVSIVCHSASP